jgi:hypothetical protein
MKMEMMSGNNTDVKDEAPIEVVSEVEAKAE